MRFTCSITMASRPSTTPIVSKRMAPTVSASRSAGRLEATRVKPVVGLADPVELDGECVGDHLHGRAHVPCCAPGVAMSGRWSIGAEAHDVAGIMNSTPGTRRSGRTPGSAPNGRGPTLVRRARTNWSAAKPGSMPRRTAMPSRRRRGRQAIAGGWRRTPAGNETRGRDRGDVDAGAQEPLVVRHGRGIELGAAGGVDDAIGSSTDERVGVGGGRDPDRFERGAQGVGVDAVLVR